MLFRYYNEFMLEERPSTECTTMRPLVRVKVVPASFGLDAFEDAVWEATEDLLTLTDDDESTTTTAKAKCRTVTFIVAAPDLMDPILMESSKESPQVEFEPDRFRLFASSLTEKLREFSSFEGVSLDKVDLTSFHPLWKNGNESGGTDIVKIDGISQGCKYFPYPSIAVSTYIEVEKEEKPSYR